VSSRQKQSLAQLLAKRGMVSSVGQEASRSKAAVSTPFFDRVVLNAASAERFDALLTRITGAVDPATLPEYPTAQCLTAEQVSGISSVGPEQEAHVATCPWCKNMLATAQPTAQEFEEILRKAKAAAGRNNRRVVALG